MSHFSNHHSLDVVGFRAGIGSHMWCLPGLHVLLNGSRGCLGIREVIVGLRRPTETLFVGELVKLHTC